MAPIFLPICVFATVVRFIALFLSVATNLLPWFEFCGVGGKLIRVAGKRPLKSKYESHKRKGELIPAF